MRTAEDTKENQEKFSKYRKTFAGQIQRLVSEGQTVQDPTMIEECKILLELAKEDQISLDDKLSDVEVLKFHLKNPPADSTQQDQAQQPVAAAAGANQNNIEPANNNANNNKRKADEAQLNDDEKVVKKAKANNNDDSPNKRVTRSQAKNNNINNAAEAKKTPSKKGRGKKNKKSQDNEADLCCVCLDEKRCVMFEPCKYVYILFEAYLIASNCSYSHMCTCQNCCALQECPLCRVAVSSTTRVYV